MNQKMEINLKYYLLKIRNVYSEPSIIGVFDENKIENAKVRLLNSTDYFGFEEYVEVEEIKINEFIEVIFDKDTHEKLK